MASIAGERVLIVGGSSGIGLGVAEVALEAGAEVTVAGRSEDRLAAAAESLGGKAATASLDATDDKAVEAFFAGGEPWHHVVCTLGKGGRGKLADLDMATVMTAMDVKFWAYFRIAKWAPIVTGGSLCLVTGGLGQKPAPGAAMLSATNAAVEGLMRGLAIDFAPTRVNCVSPGPIDTPLWDQLPEADRKALYERMEQNLPARRMGAPRDIGEAVVMLMGNKFTTGVVLQVDGGSGLL